MTNGIRDIFQMTSNCIFSSLLSDDFSLKKPLESGVEYVSKRRYRIRFIEGLSNVCISEINSSI